MARELALMFIETTTGSMNTINDTTIARPREAGRECGARARRVTAVSRRCCAPSATRRYAVYACRSSFAARDVCGVPPPRQSVPR